MSAPTSSNSHPTPAEVRRVLHYLEFGEGCDCAYCRKLHIWTQVIKSQSLSAARAESDALRAALDREPLFDDDDRIHAMNGTVRKPRTPADYVEAYRNRIRAALAPSPAEPAAPERCAFRRDGLEPCLLDRDNPRHTVCAHNPPRSLHGQQMACHNFRPAAPERCAWDKGDEDANLSPGEVCMGLRSDHDDGGVYAPAYWHHPFQPAAPEREP